MKKYLKIIISVCLISFLIYHADWVSIKTQLVSLNLVMLSVVFILKITHFPISTYKWSKCLQIHEISYSFWVLQKTLCIGFFFNNFLPTSIGGDGYRIIKTFPQDGGKSRAVSSLLLERTIGLLVLMLLGLIGSVITVFRHESKLIKLYLIVGTILLCVFLIMLLLCTISYIKDAVMNLLRLNKFEVIYSNLRYIKAHRKILFDVITISLLFHLIAITGLFLLFKMFAVQTYYSDCAVIAALMGIVCILPISINGVGVAEGSLVFVATQVGIGLDQAIIVAFTLRATTLISSLFCGVIYLVDSNVRKPEANLHNSIIGK